MKALWLMFALLLSATGARGEAPVLPFEVDNTLAGAQFAINSRVANTPVLRFYTKNGTNTWSPENYSAILFWSPSINDPMGYQLSSTTTTSSYIEFSVPTNGFSAPCKDWYCALGVTTGSVRVTYAEGVMTIDLSPEFTGNYKAARTALLDGSQYRWTNTPFLSTNSPDGVTVTYSGGVLRAVAPAAPDLVARADIAVLQTGKVDRVDTNGWTVAPHLAWLTVESDTNALARLAFETNRAITAEALLYPRNNPSGYVDAAAVTLATGTLATAIGEDIAAATGTLAGAVLADIVAATNANYASLTNWAKVQGFGDHAKLANIGWLESGHTNEPYTIGYFGEAGTPAYLSWFEFLTTLSNLFDEAGAAAAVSNAAWAQGWVTGSVTNGLASTNWVTAQGYTTNAGGGITQLVATADAAGVPSQISADRWGIGTNTTGLGGGVSSLPDDFTGRTYSVVATDTNIVVMRHSDFGGEQDLSGNGAWNDGLTQYSGPYVDVRLADGIWEIGGGGYEYTNSTPSTPVGTYYPSAEGSVGVIHVAYYVQTNAFAGLYRVTATHIGDLPAAQVVSNTAPQYVNAITNLTVTGPASASRSGGNVAVVVSNQALAASVRDYGALGNGTADDTAAIVAAIAANDVVLFTAGNYVCSNIVVSGRKTIMGVGSASRITYKAGAVGTLFDARTQSASLQIVGLDLFGGDDSSKTNQSSAGTRNAVAFAAQYTTNCLVQDSVIHGFTGYGVLVRDDSFLNVYPAPPRIVGSMFYSVWTAVSAYGYAEFVKVSECYFTHCRNGVQVFAGNVLIQNCGFRDVSVGVDVSEAYTSNGSHGSLLDSQFTGSQIVGFRATGVTLGFVVAGNQFHHDVFKMENCQGVMVQGNEINLDEIQLIANNYGCRIQGNVFLSTSDNTITRSGGDATYIGNNFTQAGDMIAGPRYVDTHSSIPSTNLAGFSTFVTGVVAGANITIGRTNNMLTITGADSGGAGGSTGAWTLVAGGVTNFPTNLIVVAGSGATVAHASDGNNSTITIGATATGGGSNSVRWVRASVGATGYLSSQVWATNAFSVALAGDASLMSSSGFLVPNAGLSEIIGTCTVAPTTGRHIMAVETNGVQIARIWDTTASAIGAMNYSWSGYCSSGSVLRVLVWVDGGSSIASNTPTGPNYATYKWVTP